MTHDPDSTIVLRIPRPQKGRYVAASRAAGLTLAAWILQQLDAGSDPITPEVDAPPSPGKSGCDDPRPC